VDHHVQDQCLTVPTGLLAPHGSIVQHFIDELQCHLCTVCFKVKGGTVNAPYCQHAGRQARSIHMEFDHMLWFTVVQRQCALRNGVHGI